jgi:hypothetical protein
MIGQAVEVLRVKHSGAKGDRFGRVLGCSKSEAEEERNERHADPPNQAIENKQVAFLQLRVCGLGRASL